MVHSPDKRAARTVEIRESVFVSAVHGYTCFQRKLLWAGRLLVRARLPLYTFHCCTHGLTSGRAWPACSQPFGHLRCRDECHQPQPTTTLRKLNRTQASLETVKTKKGDFQLLNCDDHRRLVTKKSGKDPKDLRPDIVHQVSNQNSAFSGFPRLVPSICFGPAGYN